MPEMKQVERLVREIHKFHALAHALDCAGRAEASLLTLHVSNVFSDDGHALVVADPNELLDRTGQTLLAKLRSVQDRCETVISTIHPMGYR
ncbi:hypothetical protein VN97_g7381 [Penicillium thymicola]|uniref:Uncharacterized protein n=1 Tax=Penicillium thymicola TaxID=293382 RepID=A0AAI9TFB4_PENTH|nr:hypothetical protein VN97_g7381 [Penicillium thymicola]